MRIATVTIDNFRSIKTVTCSFDAVTTFIGPNGAGKSTVLRALEWFFNGNKGALDQQDVHADATENLIRVRVDFEGLTDADHSALGQKYGGPEVTSFTVWKTWSDGIEKITARALAYSPFEAIRAAASATEKRRLFKDLRESDTALGLPTAGNAAQVDIAMDQLERQHPDRLTAAEVSDTHFFGFNSQGKLADLFDYVFVSADLRAEAETSDSRDATLGRILQHALDRASLNSEVEELTAGYARSYDILTQQHLSPQLKMISTKISEQVAEYSPGREVILSARAPAVKPQLPRIEATVTDGWISTPIGQQGHGLQRTLLLSALTVLSRLTRADEGAGQMLLAIEEPELFQHPTQARAFASVLRSLANNAQSSVQIAYATHSPHFVEPLHFDQIRRVTSIKLVKSKCAATRITSASIDDVVADLRGFLDAKNIQRRFSQTCLKCLPEALFAEAAILVEGDEDAAVLQGLGDHPNDLALQGIAVTPVSGKSNMLLPFAILKRLGINTLMVADNDSGCRDRMLKNGRCEEDILKAERDHVKMNRSLCRFVDGPAEDYPVGAVTKQLAFVPDTLETLLASELPGWDLTRKKLIEEGRAVDGKNAATYELAARECMDEPAAKLANILSLLRGARVA